MRHDGDFEKEISFEGVADKYRQRVRARSLWHIGRRENFDVGQNEELLDIFLKRGEGINDQCGPVGTALHDNFAAPPVGDSGFVRIV